MAIHAGHFNLGLKPTQIYLRQSIKPLSPQSTYVSSRIIRHYVVAFAYLHFPLPDTRVLNSYEELCIARVAAVNFLARVFNPRRRRICAHVCVYIYSVLYLEKEQLLNNECRVHLDEDFGRVYPLTSFGECHILAYVNIIYACHTEIYLSIYIFIYVCVNRHMCTSTYCIYSTRFPLV